MDYAVGDVHGCLDKVLRLLERLNYDPAQDRLIFLGDYIDRGPDSKGVLDLMIQLQRENAANVFLMGNHEDNFLAYIQVCLAGQQVYDGRCAPFFAGGGMATLLSYDPVRRPPDDGRWIETVPLEHRQFLAHLSLYWTDDVYIAVHAGVRPGIPLASQDENDLLRIRGPFLHYPHGLDKCVIFGHTPFRQVFWHADKIGIDTGACYQSMGYGKLTALCLQTRETFQVE